MSQGIAFDSEDGTRGGREAMRRESGRRKRTWHDHDRYIRQPPPSSGSSAESSGARIRLTCFLASEDEQTPELSSNASRLGARRTAASKTEANDVRLRILGARTLDQIDGLERHRLESRGMTDEAMDRVEQALKEGLSLAAAFSRWVVGDDVIRKKPGAQPGSLRHRWRERCCGRWAFRRARSTRRGWRCRAAVGRCPIRNLRWRAF